MSTSFSNSYLIKSSYRCHKCVYCHELISRRSSYKKLVGFDSTEGNFYSVCVHLECERPLYNNMKENEFYFPEEKMPRGRNENDIKDSLTLAAYSCNLV